MLIHQTPTGTTIFGYLSAVETADHGYFGGYLLISSLGRPLEFHCTAPIRPSRAQEILYGPTLRPYLLGEQIAGTLLAKSQAKPQIILTDQSSALCRRGAVGVPIVVLDPIGTDAALTTPPSLVLTVAGHTCELPPGSESDRDTVIALLSMLSNHVDLPEPFERIHEAIREAQRISSRGPEAHGEAA